MWNLRTNDTGELVYKTEPDSQHRKQTYVTEREGGMDGEISWEVGMNIYPPLNIK